MDGGLPTAKEIVGLLGNWLEKHGGVVLTAPAS
jgi:hypothetical protein